MPSRAVKKFCEVWDNVSGSTISEDFYFLSFLIIGNPDKIKEKILSNPKAKNVKVTVKKVLNRGYKYKRDKERLKKLGSIQNDVFCIRFNGICFPDDWIEHILEALGPVEKVEHWFVEGDLLESGEIKEHQSIDLLVFFDDVGDCGASTCFDEKKEPTKMVDFDGKEVLIQQKPPVVVEDIEETSPPTLTFDPLAW